MSQKIGNFFPFSPCNAAGLYYCLEQMNGIAEVGVFIARAVTFSRRKLCGCCDRNCPFFLTSHVGLLLPFVLYISRQITRLKENLRAL